MAEEAETPENTDDELLLTEEVEEQAETDETDEPEAGEGDDPEGDDEEVLTFGDDLAEEQADDSSVIKALRAEVKRLRAATREAAAPTPQKIEVGEKPTLAGCDYDEEAYEAQLEEWRDRKAQAEAQERQQTEASQKEAEAWANELKRYNDGKQSLGYADVADAEETVVATLNEVQQAVLVKAAEHPAKVMYALAKNPDRLANLATVTDPLKFAAQIARLEGQLKVVKKRKAPEPEQVERGSGGTGVSGERRLAELKRKAEQSGDYSEYFAAKRRARG